MEIEQSFFISFVFTLFLSIWVVFYYSSRDINKSQMLWLMFSTFLVLANFTLIIFDISFSFLQFRHQWIRVSWWAVFWTTLINSYLVLPLLYDYSASKENDFEGRLKQTLLRFSVKLFLLVMALLVCFLYFHVREFQMNILPILISLSYSLGLVLALFYLGYALVELPLHLMRLKYTEKSNENYKS